MVRYPFPVHECLVAIGLKMYPPVEGMAVLDVGCGTGSQLAPYQNAGCAVFGIDTSPAMLEVAGTKLGSVATLYSGSAANMPFEDEKFDLITASLVLHEMSPPVRQDVLNEAKRVVKKDGRLLLIDFHPGPFQPPKGWLIKAFLTLSEIAAGREHFRNYRDFMARRGLPYLIDNHSLAVEKQRVVSGGNMTVILTSKKNG